MLLALAASSATAALSPESFNATNAVNYTTPPLQIALTLPSYVSMQPGQQLSSQLTLENTGSLPEYINLSVGNFSSVLALSANSTFLKPNQSVDIVLLFAANYSASPGTYYIPINITTATTTGISSKQVKYVTFVVQSIVANAPAISSQIINGNNTGTATGVIQITAPKNRDIYNLTFKTLLILPLSANYNLSDVTAYGIQNNVTVANYSYVISWYVSRIAAGDSVYAYYTIRKLSDRQALSQINQVFIQPPPPVISKTNIIKVVNLGLPIFYTDSLNRINVSALYTGTTARQINFSLTAISGVKIYNGTQTVEAQPGQLLNRSFYAMTGNTAGFVFLNLSVVVNGSIVAYDLPITVLQKPVSISSIPPVVIVLLVEGVAALIYVVMRFVGRKRKQK